jgi:hypothetical protein
MKLLLYFLSASVIFILINAGCNAPASPNNDIAKGCTLARLITPDPGHFPAALAQKIMLAVTDFTVYAYAPEGQALQLHLTLVKQHNERAEAHFVQVMQHYLQYLKAGKLPGWEAQGMIAKYYSDAKHWK